MVTLEKFLKKVTSQLGEDGVIEKIFSIIKPKYSYCVEFGADDGKRGSNTWNLINNHNWNGLLIESDKTKFTKLKSNYKDRVTLLNSKVGLSGNNTLDSIFTQNQLPKNFDLLSVDIDGIDYYVWESLKKFRPRLVVIEFNPTIPNNVEFVQEKDPSVSQGSSLKALNSLAKKKGYELIFCTDWNAFFIDKKYFSLFKIKDNSLDKIYQCTKYHTQLFQLFDGTLMLHGYKQLFWHGKKIDHESIQVLPKEDRVFPPRK